MPNWKYVRQHLDQIVETRIVEKAQGYEGSVHVWIEQPDGSNGCVAVPALGRSSQDLSNLQTHYDSLMANGFSGDFSKYNHSCSSSNCGSWLESHDQH